MTIIISHRIRKSEFKRGIISEHHLDKIISGYRKGVATLIKGQSLPQSSSLIKVYATTIDGARRIVYLVDEGSQDAFLLFYRSKNDKIGENISIKNPYFRRALQKYLKVLGEDIENNNYESY